jgi:hypothetical protein
VRPLADNTVSHAPDRLAPDGEGAAALAADRPGAVELNLIAGEIEGSRLDRDEGGGEGLLGRLLPGSRPRRPWSFEGVGAAG